MLVLDSLWSITARPLIASYDPDATAYGGGAARKMVRVRIALSSLV